MAAVGRPSPLTAWDRHRRVAAMYQWQAVAARTERVYDAVWRTPPRDERSRVQR